MEVLRSTILLIYASFSESVRSLGLWMCLVAVCLFVRGRGLPVVGSHALLSSFCCCRSSLVSECLVDVFLVFLLDILLVTSPGCDLVVLVFR
jgi:hypothetical protein